MNSASKILPLAQAARLVKSWKDQGLEVVFTNGCFDILHLGHVDYLEKAKSLGDKLVVAVNSDDSVRRLKGTSRPINPENARARLLAALEFVDVVVIFGQDTPLETIRELLPDVLVKGDDYKPENIVGAEVVLQNGGKVVTLPLVEGYSTTKIIEKTKFN